MDTTELIARESVRDLIARYTWAGDRGRFADLVECFTDGGVLDVGDHGGRWVGRDHITAELESVARRTARAGGAPGPVRHHVTGTLIADITSSSAAARSYFLVTTTIGPDHWGRYFDRFTVEDGRWRIAERVVRVDGHAAGSLMV